MTKPLKSIEGYIVFCTGIHEEANEEQIDDIFSEYGNIKNLCVSLDRQTGIIIYIFRECERICINRV